MPQLADPQGSYAVLIGTNAYEHLERLPAVANNLTRLRDLLTDDGIWGLPPERCIVVSDPQTPTEFINPIKHAIENATDTFLLYYAGHGLLHPVKQDLLLTVQGSDQERVYTSIPYEWIREVLQENSDKNKIVLLDCCYSGRAFMGADASGLEDGVVRVDGTYMMAASSPTVRAMCLPNERYSAFTGELIGVLESGLEGDAEFLGLPSLYRAVLARLARKGRPKPEQHVHNAGELITFARNRGFARTPPAPRPGNRSATVTAPPPVPEQFASVVRRAPRDILAEAARLAPEQAAELLQAVGAFAVAEGVAALADLLTQQDRRSEADFVLRGAALRSPADLVSIATVLGEVGRPEAGRRLFEKTLDAIRRPDELAAIAVILKSSLSPLYSVQVFLCRGLLGYATTDEMVELIEALWAAGLDEDARGLVVLMSDRLPPDELIALADQLRGGGRVRTAFGLYRRLIHPLAQRPSHEVADLVGALRAARQIDIADRLLDAVADRLSGVRDADELSAFREALGREGLDEDAQRLPVLVADRLTLDAAITMANSLRELGQEAPADAMMLRRGLHADRDIVTLIHALREAGRPKLVFAMLQSIGQDQEPFRIPGIVATLRDNDLASDGDRVLQALAGTAQVRVVEALAAAYATRDRGFATALMRLLAEHRPEELASVVGDLAPDREQAFMDAVVTVSDPGAIKPLTDSHLLLDAVKTLKAAVGMSSEAVLRLRQVVYAHDPAVVSWLWRQSAGLPTATLTDLLGVLGHDTTAVSNIGRSCSRLSIEDMLALVADLDQRDDVEMVAKVVRHWISNGGIGVSADLLVLLLDHRGFAHAATTARYERTRCARKPDAHGITNEIAECIKAATLLGGVFLREPDPDAIRRVARDRIGTPDVKLLIPFERDLMIYYAPRGFLALTGTELVYHRSGEAVVTVAYAEFFRSEIAMTADREFRIGDRAFSLLRSGMSNRHFVDLLHSIKEIVSRGVEAPGRIEPLPADRAIFQRPKWLFAPGSTQEWDEAVREQKARRGQRPTGLESA